MSGSNHHERIASNTDAPQQQASVFEPGSKPMRVQYPQLEEIEEFQPWTEAQLRFTWYWAHPSSEFATITVVRTKINSCYDKAFGKNGTNTEKALYLTQAWPPGMEAAFLRWRVFANEERAQAAYGYKRTLRNYDLILEVNEATVTALRKKKKLESEDMKAMDAYVDITAKINKERPLLIEKIEALGVTFKNTVTNKKGDVPTTIMDRALEQVQQKKPEQA